MKQFGNRIPSARVVGPDSDTHACFGNPTDQRAASRDTAVGPHPRCLQHQERQCEKSKEKPLPPARTLGDESRLPTAAISGYDVRAYETRSIGSGAKQRSFGFATSHAAMGAGKPSLQVQEAIAVDV